MSPNDIDRLLDATAFPHPVEKLELIETHISWVILTGNYAYKIKKPVDLGFVDFTNLTRRKKFCEEELRLNRRTAPDLYLDVVPIAATAIGPKIAQEPAMEYAVRMRQFPRDARLDRQLESGRLTTGDAQAMATSIAGFHRSLSAKTIEDAVGELAQAGKFALDNFSQIRAALGDDRYQSLLSRLETWTRDQLQRLKPAFETRLREGFIRECHGDLHLGNMVRLDDGIALFDCLEFDPGLRWIDPMNDIAFLVMDLMAHRRQDLAAVFLNAYLEKSGDYPGLRVLRFYLVYRCLVRAKVSALQPGDNPDVPAEPGGNKTAQYLNLAQSLVAHAEVPHLYLMHGFSGSGKSWLSDRLIGPLAAICVRSDLERKRLHGIAPAQSSGSGIETGLYDANATERTYDCLLRYCEIGLRAGFTMIADASFLRQWQRQRFFALASKLRVELRILDCNAPLDTLRGRIQRRTMDPLHVSEAGPEVLEHQLAHHDPLNVQEQKHVIRVAINEHPDVPGLLRQLRGSSAE